MDCMLCLPTALRGGAIDVALRVCAAMRPYTGEVQGWGECCLRGYGTCCNFQSIRST